MLLAYSLWVLLIPKSLFWTRAAIQLLLKYRLPEVAPPPYLDCTDVLSRKQLKRGRQVDADIQHTATAGSINAQIETFYIQEISINSLSFRYKSIYGSRKQEVLSQRYISDVLDAHDNRKSSTVRSVSSSVLIVNTTYMIPTLNKIPAMIFAFRFNCIFHRTQMGTTPNIRSESAAHAEYAIEIACTCGAGRHFPGRPENCNQKYLIGAHWKMV